jgi:hypothetical protein
MKIMKEICLDVYLYVYVYIYINVCIYMGIQKEIVLEKKAKYSIGKNEFIYVYI